MQFLLPYGKHNFEHSLPGVLDTGKLHARWRIRSCEHICEFSQHFLLSTSELCRNDQESDLARLGVRHKDVLNTGSANDGPGSNAELVFYLNRVYKLIAVYKLITKVPV